MDFNTLILERKGRVALLTLNRPDVYNVMNGQMITELKQAISDISKDEKVQVVIITGAGKAFQSGADIQEFRNMNSMQILKWNQEIINNFKYLEMMKQPTIAAINGYALGGGLELALACTMRVASENAKIGLPEVKIGIIPGAGGIQRLSRLVGKAIAAEIILTGEMVDAHAAYRIGLVNKVVPHEELIKTSEKIAEKIAANAPISIFMAKDALEVGKDLPLDAAIQYDQKNCMTCFSTEDMKEGTRAFLEKRHPQFKGK
jgi:enoyl-CoA hydratase